MEVGRKAQGQRGLEKVLVRRHGAGGGRGRRRRASAARAEKAFETRTRREGKAACRDF